MNNTYHFGVPGIAIWLMHIAIGSFLFYIGKRISQNEVVDPDWGSWLVAMGALSIAYHAHLWYSMN